MPNFHDLTTEEKTVLKPVIKELRKAIYVSTGDIRPALKDEGLTVNFGKGAEPRFTVKIQIVA